MTKTEDEITKEKEQVAKMIGAKSAMESALSRIKRLEGVLSEMTRYLDDVQGAFGDKLSFNTYLNGRDQGHMKPILIKEQIGRISKLARDVL